MAMTIQNPYLQKWISPFAREMIKTPFSHFNSSMRPIIPSCSNPRINTLPMLKFSLIWPMPIQIKEMTV